MQKTIGVLVAMSVEYRQVAAIMQDTETLKSGPQEFLVGRVGENKVALLQCGIGKANAASGVTNLILTFHPDCIISTGVAGGIDAKLKVMDVVISKEACYHDVICGDDCDPGQVQGLPKFFRGDERKFLREWVYKYLKYPASAVRDGVSGKVTVGFVIEKEGSVSGVEVVKSLDGRLDEEALRVIKVSPKWTPGEIKGKAVRTRIVLPVEFRLK